MVIFCSQLTANCASFFSLAVASRIIWLPRPNKVCCVRPCRKHVVAGTHTHLRLCLPDLHQVCARTQAQHTTSAMEQTSKFPKFPKTQLRVCRDLESGLLKIYCLLKAQKFPPFLASKESLIKDRPSKKSFRQTKTFHTRTRQTLCDAF